MLKEGILLKKKKDEITIPGQSDDIDKGGTLRLGNYPCVIQPGTQMEHCYQRSVIQERHRCV